MTVLRRPLWMGVRAATGLVILALAARTFVGMGWLQPIVVAGGSMAPKYTGKSLAARCDTCETSWRIDLASTESDACPECGGSSAVVGHAPADRVFARRFGSPEAIKRWDAVLLQSPEDARRMLIKRVLGLPGEGVSIANGDLWIDEKRIVKSLAQQLRLRIPVSTTARGWTVLEDEWLYDRPLTDSLPYNAHVSRMLQPSADRMVTLTVDTASCDVLVSPGCPPTLQVRLTRPATGRPLQIDARLTGLELATAEHAAVGDAEVVVSTFDRWLLVAVGSEVVLNVDLSNSAVSEPAPVRIRGHGFDTPRLYRDIYYEPGPNPGTWGLGPSEWFLVGDNQAISRDSRNWRAAAGVPGRLLVGVVSE